MSIFTGFTNLKESLNNLEETIYPMSNILKKNNSDNIGYLFNKHVCFAQTINNPITFKFGENTYNLIFNGNLYNKEDIKKELLDSGFEFSENSDSEILVKAFIHFGYEVVNHLNGAFSFVIWNENKQELFFARDHLGIKPLYYSLSNNTLIFSSEIKSILEYPGIDTIIDSTSICELIGLGPAHTPGLTPFKNIFELKPAHFGVFNLSGLHINKYWYLKSKEHTDSFGKTCEHIYDLLGNSIKKQLVSSGPICTMLSGGLDSSIITAYASNYFKDNEFRPTSYLFR